MIERGGLTALDAAGHNDDVERARAYLVSVLLLAASAAPGFRDPSADGFPFSTYPMFSQRRGRVHSVTSARAVAADGATLLVPPRFIANAETMQAVRTLSSAVRAGEARSLELCRRIAERLRATAEPAFSAATRVELVTQRVDAIAFLAGRAEPQHTRVHASCPIGADP